MKQQTIQSLLEKYREGTLTESELAELERLTHKDEVMAAASRRATGIIVRRYVVLAMTVLIVGGAGVWAVLPHEGQDSFVAENRIEVQIPPEEAVEEMQQPVVTALVQQPTATAPVRKPKAVAKVSRKREIPVVVCNNQCDADSVINDIKKFLSV